MSDYNLGTARGTIEIDYKGDGATQATAGLKGVSKTAESGDAAVRKVGTGFTVAGASIAAGLGVAIKTAADFEKGLSGIQAVSGASTAEMETVRKKALQLGADTAFSATDASAAIEELVKAGISIPDVMNGAADATVALAAAGGVSLPEAATIASNAMNQFGLSAKELPAITDQIAGAANASAIDVSQLGQSMSQVGAVANLAGLSFKDTAVAIAEMGNAGIKGSDAGTSLKTMLQNLIPQTEAQTNEMVKLGLITTGGQTAMQNLAKRGIRPLSNSYADVQGAILQYVKKTTGLAPSSAKAQKAAAELGAATGAIQNQFFDATGKAKSLADIQGVLAKAYKGSSQEQMLASQGLLFGQDAIRASAVLTKNGADGYNKMSAAMGKVSAADVAKTRMQNLAGQVEQLKGSSETFAIQLGSVLIPMFTKLVSTLTGVVNWFTSLSGAQQKAIVSVLATAAGLLLFIGALIKLVQFAQAAKATMLALNGTFLANPIVLIILAVIALVAAIILLWKNSETFRKIVTAVWEAVKGAALSVASWFTGTLVPWFQRTWNSITSGLSSLWASMVGIWNSIISTITGVWNTITSTISSAWAAITSAVTAGLNFVVSLITTGVNMILAPWRFLWGLFGPLVLAVFDLIKAIIQVAVAWIVVAVQTYLNLVLTVWRTIWSAIVTVVTTYVNAVRTVISTVFGFIRTVISAYLNAYRAVISAVWNGILAVIRAVMNAIRAVVSAVWGAIGGRVMAAVNGIRSAVSSAFNAVRSIASSVFNALVSIISGRINAAKSAVSSAVSAIRGIFSGAGSWLYDSGKRLIQGLIDGIRSMVGAAANAIKGVADKIRGFLPGSPIKEGPLRDHGWNQGRPGSMLMSSLAEGINSEMDTVNAALSRLSPDLPSTLTSAGVAAASSAGRTALQDVAAASKVASQPSGQLVPIKGTLGIDPSGQAWIEGIAQNVQDNNDGFGATLGRMGGFGG